MSELQQGEQPRTYIVTGAAGGIGGATVKRLLATGANVLGGRYQPAPARYLCGELFEHAGPAGHLSRRSLDRG
ncbi:hypothetical protein ACFSTD_19525 [Novosphingobium colocasiae]